MPLTRSDIRRLEAGFLLSANPQQAVFRRLASETNQPIQFIRSWFADRNALQRSSQPVPQRIAPRPQQTPVTRNARTGTARAPVAQAPNRIVRVAAPRGQPARVAALRGQPGHVVISRAVPQQTTRTRAARAGTARAPPSQNGTARAITPRGQPGPTPPASVPMPFAPISFVSPSRRTRSFYPNTTTGSLNSGLHAPGAFHHRQQTPRPGIRQLRHSPLDNGTIMGSESELSMGDDDEWSDDEFQVNTAVGNDLQMNMAPRRVHHFGHGFYSYSHYVQPPIVNLVHPTLESIYGRNLVREFRQQDEDYEITDADEKVYKRVLMKKLKCAHCGTNIMDVKCSHCHRGRCHSCLVGLATSQKGNVRCTECDHGPNPFVTIKTARIN